MSARDFLLLRGHAERGSASAQGDGGGCNTAGGCAKPDRLWETARLSCSDCSSPSAEGALTASALPGTQGDKEQTGMMTPPRDVIPQREEYYI